MNDLAIISAAIEAAFVLSRTQSFSVRRIGRGYAFDFVSNVPELCISGEAPTVELLLLEVKKQAELSWEKQRSSLEKSKELLSCGS